MTPSVPTRPVAWTPVVRLVDAGWPPMVEIEAARSSAELDAAMALIGATDPARAETARIRAALPDEDRRVVGPAAGDAVSPYLFASTGRFSEPGAGAFYAARTLDTALAESLHHRARTFARSGAGVSHARLRHLVATVSIEASDVRGRHAVLPELYDPTDGGTPATRAFAAELRRDGSRGIVYDSLRDREGECIAVFAARDISLPVRTAGIIERTWHPSTGWLP